MENKYTYTPKNIHTQELRHKQRQFHLTMRLKTLGLFLFLLLLVPFHCKLILSTSKPHPSQSHAEILNTSLQRFDNFTLCGRYRITGCYPKSSGVLLQFIAIRFLTFNFLVEFQKTRHLIQYIFAYFRMLFLGNHTFNLQ